MDTTCRITGEAGTHTYITATGERTYINVRECIKRGHGDPYKIASIRATLRPITTDGGWQSRAADGRAR